MAGELCAVLLQAFCLTLDSTTVIGVFLIMLYFTYFMCNPIASSLCDTKHSMCIIVHVSLWGSILGMLVIYKCVD